MNTYNRKTVYLGIDVHKKTYAVTAICDGGVMKKTTMRAEPEGLVRYCEKFFAGACIISAYEAGFCGFHLHRILIAAGINNLVVNPSDIEINARNRVKTDKRDSLKIATQLAAGRLHGIYIPSVEQELSRTVSRLRESLVRQRSRLACQLKNVLFLFGYIPYSEKLKVCSKWVEKILEKSYPEEIKYTIDTYVACWKFQSQRIKEVENELKKQAETDIEIHMIYESHPGIGLVSARTLANELGDMSQFKNEKCLYSYIGLTPSEHSSGDHRQLGHITHQGKAILRKILIQAAWIAIKHDESLNQIYTRASVTAGKHNAIVGVARRMIGRLRACLRKNELYVIQKDADIVTIDA